MKMCNLEKEKLKIKTKLIKTKKIIKDIEKDK